MSLLNIIAFLVLISITVVGCSRTPAEKTDLVCVKRPDLRLVVATMTRDQQGIEQSLQEGADANTSVEGLAPPIVIAALTDNYDAVKLLLDKGANINASDSQGYTPLINASLNSNRKIVQLLLARGADVNASAYPSINGKKVKLTALMIAKSKGQDEIAQSLTEAGAKE